MRKTLPLIVFFWLWSAGYCCCCAASLESYAAQLSGLIDPARLATLRERGANPRVYKYVALLHQASSEGFAPKKVATRAGLLVGMKGEALKLTTSAMVLNYYLVRKFGCLDPDGLQEMRHGQAPTVRTGSYKGQSLSVDHIIPRAVVPELDNVIANLELMPLQANEKKNAKVGSRQVKLGQKLHRAGLLSTQGLQALEAARR